MILRSYSKSIFIFLTVLSLCGTAFSQNVSKELPLKEFSILSDTVKIMVDGKEEIYYKKGIFKNNDSLTGAEGMSSRITPVGDLGASSAITANIVPPSPNSSILSSLIADNVDLYTGKTSVNVPLYNLKCNSIEMPISLQTNADAHRVNDYGSWVGLGWNLNAGGTITRVIKNLPDEQTGIISSDFPIQGYGYMKIKALGIDLSNFDAIDITTKKNIINEGNWNIKTNQPTRGLDLQPDEFFFSFGKYTGKFVFDQDGNINLIPQANFKITPFYAIRDGVNKISGFTILTDDGFKYEFGDYALNAVEESALSSETRTILYTYRAFQPDPSNYGIYLTNSTTGYILYEQFPYMLGEPARISGPPGEPNLSYIANGTNNFDVPTNNETLTYNWNSTTWHLTKITAPTSEWINLNYTGSSEISYLSDRNYTNTSPDFSNRSFTLTGPTTNQFVESAAQPVDMANRKMLVYPSVSNFSVNTTNIQLRLKKLSTITTSQGSTVNFLANTVREDFPNDKRLDKISISHRGIIIKSFDLSYEDKANPDPSETFRFSYSKSRYYSDGQGYYMYMGRNTVFRSGAIEAPFAQEDRVWPVPDYCKHRLYLKSVQELSKTQNNTLPAYKFEYNLTQMPYRTSTEQDKYGFPNSNPTRFPFLTSAYFVRSPFYTNSFQIGNAVIPVDVNPTYAIGQQANWPPILNITTGNKNFNQTKIMAGVLTKIVYPTGGYKEFIYEKNGDPNFWSGLRVSEIKEKDNLTTAEVKKIYTYGTYVATDAPTFQNFLPETLSSVSVGGAAAILQSSRKVMTSSGRVNPEYQTKGSSGGYDWVEIQQPNNGKYKAEFTTAADYPDAFNLNYIATSCFTPNIQSLPEVNLPYPQTSSCDWKRGLMKNEFFYKQDATMVTPLLVKSTTYNYDVNTTSFGEKIITGINVTKYNLVATYPALCAPSGSWNWLLFTKNNYTSKWFTLNSKTERNYAPDGITFIESKDDYSYKKYTHNNKDYLYMNSTLNNSNSKNEQTVFKTRYLLDYTIPTNYNGSDPFIYGMSLLRDKNVLTAKIEEYAWRQDINGNNKKYLDGKLVKYGAPISPVEIFKLKNDLSATSHVESDIIGSSNFIYNASRYNLEASFFKNPTGSVDNQLTNQNKVNDVSEFYKWDYTRMYPVAKIISSVGSYDDFSCTSFETIDSPDEGIYALSFISTRLNDAGITGKKVFPLNSSQSITRNLRPSITYKVSLWATNNTVTISGASANRIGRTVGNYTYYEWEITGQNSILISGEASLDELRVYPKKSLMTTYTYDPLVGITSECNPNNMVTSYEYDQFSRLSLVRDQDKNIIKKVCYNYAGRVEDCPSVLNGLPPTWVVTGNTRCQPCPLNNNYLTGLKEREEINTNPNSNNPGATQWIVDPNAILVGPRRCTPSPADWQTVNIFCEVDIINHNTGNQIIIKKDLNPCSLTGGQIIQIIEMNTGACPLPPPPPEPCTTFNCAAPQYKCINNYCTVGTWCVLSSVKVKNYWRCSYGYVFPDGTNSGVVEIIDSAIFCRANCMSILAAK
jgi:YD repeat-containing protein